MAPDGWTIRTPVPASPTQAILTLAGRPARSGGTDQILCLSCGQASLAWPADRWPSFTTDDETSAERLHVVVQDAPAQRGTPLRRSTTQRAVVLLLLVGVLGLAVLLSIAVGARPIPLGTVWQLLWHDDGSELAYFVRDLRLHRTLLGLLVGAALGMAGALMQALTRNPLADPGLLGVSIGASAAVVVAVAFLGITSLLGYVWFAFAGAAVVSVLVYLLGSTGRAVTPDRMVLAGAAISAVLGSFVGIVVLASPRTFDFFRFWAVGSLAGRGSDVFWQISPFMVVGCLLALTLGGALNALALGDETGRALGVTIGRTRVLTALTITLLCGAATAAAGPIEFVGLVVPHIARILCGPDNRWVLAYSLVLGPLMLIGPDIVGRFIIWPSELEVGIITAVIGAPVFLLLCRRRRIAQL